MTDIPANVIEVRINAAAPAWPPPDYLRFTHDPTDEMVREHSRGIVVALGAVPAAQLTTVAGILQAVDAWILAHPMRPADRLAVWLYADTIGEGAVRVALKRWTQQVHLRDPEPPPGCRYLTVHAVPLTINVMVPETP